MTTADPLCGLIDDLLSILRTGEHDVTWSSYRTTSQAVKELEELRGRIEHGDAAAHERLRFLCLPTGAIEEIAVSSGWAPAWVQLINEKYASAFA